MLPRLRYTTNVIRKIPLNARNIHNKPPKELSTQVLQENLVQAFYQNVGWLNEKYEHFFGISQIRQIQEKVLEAESDFVVITQNRKQCQEQIDKLKESVEKLRDKLETTSRSSDRYLQLITEEHEVLKEQNKLKTQLNQLKEREQFTFDRLSKLLRQSHETERLRQEKSKYWNLISVSFSVSGTIITLLAYKVKNQNANEKEKSKVTVEEKLEHVESVLVELKSDMKSLYLLVRQIDESNQVTTSIKKNQPSSWTSYIPSLSSLTSWFGYLYWW